MCAAHINKSSAVHNTGSTISSFPFRFPSHLHSLGLLGHHMGAQLQSSLACLFTASLKNTGYCSWDHAGREQASPAFLRPSQWLQVETQCRSIGQRRS